MLEVQTWYTSSERLFRLHVVGVVPEDIKVKLLAIAAARGINPMALPTAKCQAIKVVPAQKSEQSPP